MLTIPTSHYQREAVYDRTFVGRERELIQLRDILFRKSLKPSIAYVSGMAGVGKTALLNAVFSTAVTEALPYWLDLHAEVSPDEEIASFLKFLHSSASQRRTFIILDGVEYLTERILHATLEQLFKWPSTHTVVVASRNQIRLSDSWAVDKIALEPLNDVLALRMLLNAVDSNFSVPEAYVSILKTNGVPLEVAKLAAAKRSADKEPYQIRGHLYEINKNLAVPSTEIIQAVRPAIITGSEDLIRALQKHPRDIYNLPPRAFEKILADILADMGWEVHLTPATRDGGKDILAYMNTSLGRILCLVEAKRYSEHRTVGVDLVRSLYGTLCDHQANSGVLVTTSSFSKDAHDFRQRHRYQLALRDYVDVTRWLQHYGTDQRSSLLSSE